MAGKMYGNLLSCMWMCFLVVVPLASSSREVLSSKECENLGFSGLALCSDCNTLAEYVKDQG